MITVTPSPDWRAVSANRDSDSRLRSMYFVVWIVIVRSLSFDDRAFLGTRKMLDLSAGSQHSGGESFLSATRNRGMTCVFASQQFD